MVMAALSCYLEVDVNGEETFIVDKEILCTPSSKLSKLFGRLRATTVPATKLKVIFNDFPGGAKSFELLTRFCYNNGRITLTPFNICLLHSAAHYMEMDKACAEAENLVQQTDNFLKEISYWSWNELMASLLQCQDTLKLATSSSLLQKCVESVVERIASASEATSYLSSSSSDSSGLRFSCDTKSTAGSLMNRSFHTTWWFEDLALLRPDFLQYVVKFMASQKLDNLIISKFLFFYHKSRLAAAVGKEKPDVTTAVINMLYLLDWSLVSYKRLLGLLRTASGAKLEKSCRNKLENMIGSQLDQATLDNLLIPSRNGTKYLYDVNLVLRLIKSFARGGCNHVSLIRLRKVSRLMDLYISEVAPDPHLKPCKLLALATALPDFARESYDGVYRAIDLYIQVHSGLSKEDKLKICSALNYHKLSPEACAHLAQNTKFPSKSVLEAIISQQFKLKSVLRNITLGEDPQNFTSKVTESIKDKSAEEALGHDATDNVTTQNQKLQQDIHGMQWRVLELEKLRKKMQSQMTRIVKSKPGNPNGFRSLPKLCS
uniref:NPH3 domain-containing protein n=1 Tax=Kalanchoe fedtschenkoi TaxID=63787 RepID=A0A7N0ZTG3_KALFE